MDHRLFKRRWSDETADPADPGPGEFLALGFDGRWYLVRGSSAAEVTRAEAVSWALVHGRALPAELEHAATKRGVASFNLGGA